MFFSAITSFFILPLLSLLLIFLCAFDEIPHLFLSAFECTPYASSCQLDPSIPFISLPCKILKFRYHLLLLSGKLIHFHNNFLIVNANHDEFVTILLLNVHNTWPLLCLYSLPLYDKVLLLQHTPLTMIQKHLVLRHHIFFEIQASLKHYMPRK